MAGLPCQACGARNRAQGRFCRKCGAVLAADADAPLLAGGGGLSAESARPQPLPAFPEVRELAVLLLSILLLSVVVAVTASVEGDTPELDVAACVAFTAITFIFTFRSVASLRPLLSWPSARAWLHGFGAAVLVAPLLELAFWLIHQLGFPFHDYLTPYLARGWPLWVPFVVTALVTPITEEIVFRGIVQQGLERALGAREAWIVQAFLFSAAHLSPVILVTHFAMGLLLGWLRRTSGSLYPGVVLHALWNAWVLWCELA